MEAGNAQLVEMYADMVRSRALEDVIISAVAEGKVPASWMSGIGQEGAVTIAQVRDLLSASRKYALALMEYLDEQRVTRRVGESAYFVVGEARGRSCPGGVGRAPRMG